MFPSRCVWVISLITWRERSFGKQCAPRSRLRNQTTLPSGCKKADGWWYKIKSKLCMDWITHPLEAWIVGIPGYDRNAQVAGQLEEVLHGGCGASVRLRVEQVQDGRHVVRQEVVAQSLQDLCGRKTVLWSDKNIGINLLNFSFVLSGEKFPFLLYCVKNAGLSMW